MEHEVDRFRCMSDDGTCLTVLEHRHIAIVDVEGKTRSLRGARRLALSTGERVRYIDANTFEVVDTGELLRRS